MKKILKEILTKNFQYLAFFYGYLKNKIFVVLALSVLVGLMDGLGLSMFIPLLDLLSNSSASSAGSGNMGGLSFVLDWITYFGFHIELLTVLSIILIFFSIKGFFKWIEQYMFTLYLQFFIRTVRVENINNLGAYKYEEFINADVGRIQNSMTAEVERVVQAYRIYSQVLQQISLVVTYGVLAFMSNPQFAIFVLIGGGLVNIIFNSFYKKTKGLSGSLVKSNHQFQGYVIQLVQSFKYLRATGYINEYVKKLSDKVREIEGTNQRMGMVSSFLTGIREPIMIFVVVVIIFVQVKLLAGSIGAIVLSVLFFYRALNSIMQIQVAYNTFLTLSGSIENLKNFSLQLIKGKQKTGGQVVEELKEKISFQNVTYQYQNEPVLRNISIDFRKNETIAIVGESGSGKTTLLNLLVGLLHPSSGRILFDNIDINEIDNKFYAKRFGYITQEAVIFNDSIFDNVTFWSEPTNENYDRFNEVMQQAELTTFLDSPNRTANESLGMSGINLSGGQRQRISIARELFKHIDVLCLDEATSSLDTETENAIKNNLDKLRGRLTLVIVAHRLATVKGADRIVLLNKGQIEMVGSYEEVLAKSEIFKRMVELQKL